MQETWLQSLGWEDPLEKDKATHSSILATGLENPVDYVVHGVAKSQTWLSDFHFTSLHPLMLKQIYWDQVVVKKSVAFIVGIKWVQAAHAQKPWTPQWLSVREDEGELQGMRSYRCTILWLMVR